MQKLKTPNFFQTQRQFLWDAMFFTMLGTSYLKPSQKIITDSTQIYWLDSSCIEFPNKTQKQLDKIVISNRTFKDIQKLPVKYHYKDGTCIKMQLGDIKAFIDLTNNTGNWYKGNSRLDTLYKIIDNSEKALSSKNTNLEFSGKYLVSGSYDPKKNLDSFANMGDIEKEDIRSEMRSGESVYPIKTMAEIKRFVENISNLKLDDSYNESLVKIADVYNMPMEMLNVKSSNGIGDKGNSQDKARAAHVYYCLKPKGDDIINGLAQFMGDNTQYTLSWDHLPFMKTSEKDKSIIRMTDARTFEAYVKNGAQPSAVAEMLGIDLTFNNVDNG